MYSRSWRIAIEEHITVTNLKSSISVRKLLYLHILLVCQECLKGMSGACCPFRRMLTNWQPIEHYVVLATITRIVMNVHANDNVKEF